MHSALTIAGSDSGAGAGIQADLKTFAAHGVYGTCAITAVTAQNTVGVTMWQAMPADLVTAQIEAIAEDIPPQAVKVGMLANAAVTEAVAAAIAELDLPHVVVDPVMIAKGGDRLLEEEAIEAIRTELLPRAHVVTPNISEAEVLSGLRITDIEGMRRAGKAILGLGPRLVIVKGGHLEGPESVDVVTGIHEEFEVRGPRIPGRNTHGTGCTLSSAIAANLARGLTDRAAITRARQYLEGAIRHAPGLGRGHGPLQHFWGRYTENR
ncbi:MAG TPA: bifunctional hydroxymethylpyrimidine kinase/phosphomethylpyrimidine kinase [Vicinamibacterales bacterium]|jgi:hydroxymethylpyrimidine/phosphomethylpyrimidine kinase|nr:bifunctional hydroxymethylpyrimidine kinase/phosphomethylpyrimidine kinase [Vicinamibacterales bacterium]